MMEVSEVATDTEPTSLQAVHTRQVLLSTAVTMHSTRKVAMTSMAAATRLAVKKGQ